MEPEAPEIFLHARVVYRGQNRRAVVVVVVVAEVATADYEARPFVMVSEEVAEKGRAGSVFVKTALRRDSTASVAVEEGELLA